MIDKRVESVDAAVSGVRDGSVVLVSGFGGAGSPVDLIHALAAQDAKDLTLVSNNAGQGDVGLARLLATRRVKKVICSYPRSSGSYVFDQLYAAGDIELELCPQGTLAERIRAGGAGVGAFFTPTGVGTDMAVGKEVRDIGGRPHILEPALRGHVALIKAEAADRWGNLIYRKAARNFGPVMCTAADLVIVQVRRIVELGDLDPECIVTPGLFVDRVVEVREPSSETEAMADGKARP